MQQRVPWLVLIVFVVGVGLWRVWPRAEARAWITAPVERADVRAVVSATGTLDPLQTVEVGTYVSGRIVALDADFNSQVEAGQRIAKIDPANYEVAVLKAEANLATARGRRRRAEAELALEKAQFERQRRLLSTTVASQDEFDAARSAYQQARAQVEIESAALAQATAGLQDARVNLERTDIRSPVRGVVLARNVDVGQTVAATFQTPTLFLIANDLTRMLVVASVSESDIGRLREGQPATFGVDAYPGRVFEGRVTQVRNAPIEVQNVVTYEVIIDVDNPDLALKPGMTAVVELITDRREGVLRIPLRALRFQPAPRDISSNGARPGPGALPPVDSGGGGVWVRDGRKLRRVALQLGVRDDRAVEIAAGALAEGDEVVVGYRRGG